ncbi:phospholipid-transporting ATPase ABCA3-like [Cydia fagiglandana]|uniref:phospholipid-transporting ATPase ABCA3-like n=1 Tax=Cydia fagiglandana TaxID=1458189 RepID=UPI002FEE17D5
MVTFTRGFCLRDPACIQKLETENWILQNTQFSDEKLHQSSGNVLYSPESELTDRLMHEVGAKLNLQRLDHLPSKQERGYFPFSRETSLTMMKYTRDIMSSKDAIVIFENMNSYPWPSTLNYTIRMKTLKTDYTTTTSLLEPEAEPYDTYKRGSLHMPNLNTGENYDMQSFLRLQWAIDTSYLQLTTRSYVDQTLALQEFPFSDEKFRRTQIAVFVFAAAFLPLVVTLPMISLTKRLFGEKISGIHVSSFNILYLGETEELQKISGVSAETIAFSYVLDLLSVLLVNLLVYILYFKLAGYLVHTSCFYLALAIALGFFSVLAFTFIVFYVLDVSTGGITMSNMWSHRDEMRKVSVGEAYMAMAFQILLFSVISWYLSKVRPGKFGQPWPWNFPFKPEYWSNQPPAEAVQRGVETINPNDKQYFEKAPDGLPVGIQVNNVYKAFGKETVLHGVNLDVYRGEITVLLGNNGAGKTTLLNIITGLLKASSGTVLIEGKDTMKHSVETRKLIGLCPQHNMFFEFLRVQEHVRFFAMLKGQSCAESRASSAELLAKLQLSDKLKEKPTTLSGGMKRRVQLACAVAGGARVLVLDEPTSGLDVETRRELSNVLLGLRGQHTVLLTTHFMEEADALGDRIAALHHGRVRCHASPMFLKRAIGTGHRLTFTTLGAPNEEAITRAITSVVPDATVRDRRPTGLTYNLPSTDTSRFPKLFTTLEQRRSELQIDTIGVSRSTLDEVFLELCSDEKPTYEEKETPTIDPGLEKVTGCKLRAQQFVALFQRQCYFVKLLNFIIVVIIMGALACFVSLAANNDPDAKKKPDPAVPKPLNLDLYTERPQRHVLVKADESTLQSLRAAFEGVQFEKVLIFVSAVLRTRRENMEEYKKYLMGIELNDISAKALYTPSLRNAAPVALNALSNALAARLTRLDPLRSMGARTINVRNRPLRGAYVPYDEAELRQPKKDDNIMIWSSFTAMSEIIFNRVGPRLIFMPRATSRMERIRDVDVDVVYLSSCVQLPSLERATGTRHAYVMTGTPRWLHWAALYAGRVSFTLIIVLIIVLFTFLLEKDHTFNQLGFLVALLVVLMLGILAVLGLVYFVSTLFTLTTATAVLFIVIVLTTFFTANVKESEKFFHTIMYIPYVLFPPHALTVGLIKSANVAQVNSHCNLNRGRCPELTGPGPFKAETCCGSPSGSEPWSYWSISDAAGVPMLVLVFQAVAYFILTYLSDSGTLERLTSSAAAPPELRFNDAAVQAEAHYVEDTIKLPNNQIPDAVLGYKIQKRYSKCCKKPYQAVKSVSFSVKKGECFGLLGVNGAGKSTTFKLLTSETAATGGQIFANGYRSTERSKYMPTLSYCPQFDGVDGFLTGRQNLTLLLKLRGLKAPDAAALATAWIKEVDLLQHADKPVSSYSGGMARRLTAAAAFCQPAKTAILDEPTAGVDPVARHHMHQALMSIRRQKSIIIASHSLDEMETLCHRIAIMSGGELRALGSAAALKIQHAQGYTVVFKLATEKGEGLRDIVIKQNFKSVKDDVLLNEFKERLNNRFDCQLKDQHRNMLSYHVKTSVGYSTLFALLEEQRAQFPELVEDYTVSDTTLEEVFLVLAREAKEAQQPPPTV